MPAREQGKYLSSPNRVLWAYFRHLRKVVRSIQELTLSKEELQEEVMIAVILAILAVECFVNAFFRILVEEQGFETYRKQILSDLESKAFLRKKLQEWPKLCFKNKKGLELGKGIGQRFLNVMDVRKKLEHFTPSYEGFNAGNFRIEGLANTTVLDALDASTAVDALESAEGIIAEILELRGTPKKEIPHALHHWTGKPPQL